MRLYNLFCRADRDELICAVPEDRPVPSFITGPVWDFVGRVEESVIRSVGFNHDAAQASIQLNGFYLFQLVNASGIQPKTRQSSAAEAVDDIRASGNASLQEVSGQPSEIRIASVHVRVGTEVKMPSDSRVSPLPDQINEADLHVVRK